MPYKNLPESEWGKMDACVDKVQGQGHDKQSAIAICYTTISGKEYQSDPQMERVGNQYRVFDANSGQTYKQVDSAREAMTLLEGYKATADINDLPDGAFLHIEAGGTKDDTGRTVPRSLRHLPYKTESGAIDLPKLRNALSRLGQTGTGDTGGDKWLTESLRKELQSKAEKILANNTDAESAKEADDTRPGLIDRLIAALTSNKEGKRNSASDADRLQQIHDLSVENGAACPMVLKQANGKHRWILLSTNSYQDRDGEIVSQKAQEADVDRMNATHDFGPLRMWHMGYPDIETKEAGPGVDIGDCDFAQMFGRVRVESGTFKDERIAAAIKGRADQWAGSIGFFHPLDQPDRNGVYADSYTFERSLLPRAKASNYLTPLAAIVKENAMTTKEEKEKQLSDLLGDASLASAILKQVDATEKAAQERGLKYKAADAPAPEKGKKGAEGSAEEEATEPKKEAEEEGDKPDYEAMAKGLAPHISKMIEEKMREAKEKTAAKEAGLETAIKELTEQVKSLTADQPRGFFTGYRPSQSGGTLLRGADGKPVASLKESQPVDPVESVIDQLIKGAQMPFMPPT